MSFIYTVISVMSLLIVFYLGWLFLVLYRMTDVNYKEFREFKGNGRGVINKNGKMIVVKYKTLEDHKRFLNGIGVIDLHDD